MSLWDMQDKFHDADTETDRDAVRQEMRDNGYDGVATTIKPVSEGGTDWREENH